MKRNRIRNIPILLRHRSYRRRTAVSILAWLGALATVREVLDATGSDQVAGHVGNLWIVGGVALAGALVVLFLTLPSAPPASQPARRPR